MTSTAARDQYRTSMREAMPAPWFEDLSGIPMSYLQGVSMVEYGTDDEGYITEDNSTRGFFLGVDAVSHRVVYACTNSSGTLFVIEWADADAVELRFDREPADDAALDLFLDAFDGELEL